MELEIKDGDYVFGSLGTLSHIDGSEALLQRVLFRLTAHRGMFPFLNRLGSNLWLLGRLSAAERKGAAEQYVAEALADEEGLQVESVSLQDGENGTQSLCVQMNYDGEDLAVSLTVR